MAWLLSRGMNQRRPNAYLFRPHQVAEAVVGGRVSSFELDIQRPEQFPELVSFAEISLTWRKSESGSM